MSPGNIFFDSFIKRLEALEDTYVRTYWYETINSGTNGTLAPPSGGTIELDQFAEGVDALASTFSGSYLTWQTPLSASGAIVAATLDGAGNWTLTDTPAAYPVAIIYSYKVKLVDFDFDYSIGEAELTRLSVADASELTQWLTSAALSADGSMDIAAGNFETDGIVNLPSARGAVGGIPAAYLKLGNATYLHEWTIDGVLVMQSQGNNVALQLYSALSASVSLDKGATYGATIKFKEGGSLGAQFGFDSSRDMLFETKVSNRGIYFTVNKGGTATDAIWINGQNARTQFIATGSGAGIKIGNGFILYEETTNIGALATGDSLKAHDNGKFYCGTGNDSSMYYDGTNLILNPKEVGSGRLRVLGTVDSKGRVSAVATKSADYTITLADETISYDTSGGAWTVDLPAAPITGEMHRIALATNGNTLTIDGNGNDISGDATQSLILAGEALQVVYNGTQWDAV